MSGKSVLGGLTAFQWKKINKYSYFFVSPFQSRAAAMCWGRAVLWMLWDKPVQGSTARAGWAGAWAHVFCRVKALESLQL